MYSRIATLVALRDLEQVAHEGAYAYSTSYKRSDLSIVKSKIQLENKGGLQALLKIKLAKMNHSINRPTGVCESQTS